MYLQKATENSEHVRQLYVNSMFQQRRRRNMKPAHRTLLLWHIIAVVYYLTSICEGSNLGAGTRLVDLSHTFDNTTIYWVTEPTLKLNVTFNGTSRNGDYWYQKDQISAATHGGTHLDAPCHFAKGRWCVSDIPLQNLVVPAVVVDIRSKVNRNPDVHLNIEHLQDWEMKHGRIPDGSLLLINTGWSRFWPDPLAYSGSEVRNATLLRFPSIKSEVAEWLVASRNVVGVGIDTMSLDVPNEKVNTHVTLMENNIYGLENVNNLDLLPAVGADVFVMPMKLRFASGAPCRIVAQISEAASGSSCGAVASSVFVAVVALAFVFLS